MPRSRAPHDTIEADYEGAPYIHFVPKCPGGQPRATTATTAMLHCRRTIRCARRVGITLRRYGRREDLRLIGPTHAHGAELLRWAALVASTRCSPGLGVKLKWAHFVGPRAPPTRDPQAWAASFRGLSHAAQPSSTKARGRRPPRLVHGAGRVCS